MRKLKDRDPDALGVPPGRVVNGKTELGLSTRYVGASVHYIRSVGSTNAVLHELAADDAPSGTVVLADEQTGGRGRVGRAWFSPEARGIWVSVLLRTDLPAERLAPLSVAGAVAVAEALRKHTGLDVRVKWPNDLMVEERKLGGLLVESAQAADGSIEFASVGLGLNVNLRGEEIPPELAARATSLAVCLGHDVSRLEVLRTVLLALEECFEKFERGGMESFRAQWRELSMLLGRKVVLQGTQGDRVARVVDIAPTGALRLELPSGEIEEVWHGDVTLQSAPERGTNDD